MVRGSPNPRHFLLPQRLRAARTRLGLSGRALSVKAGLSEKALHPIEAGNVVPSIDTLAAIAGALAVSPAWLAFGEEPTAAPDSQSQGASFAERLIERREALGHGRKTLAKIAELSDTTVRACEAGDVMPTLVTLEKLARALNVRPGWLAFGLGESPLLPALAGDPKSAS